MNKQRRTVLSKVVDTLNKLDLENDVLATFVLTADEALEHVNDVLSDEQSAYDNMPEGLQNAERGETMMAGIEALENAVSSLESLKDHDGSEGWREDAETFISEAIEYLEEASA